MRIIYVLVFLTCYPLFVFNGMINFACAQNFEKLDYPQILQNIDEDKWQLTGNHTVLSPDKNIFPDREPSEKLDDYDFNYGIRNQLLNMEDSLHFNISLFKFDEQVLAFGFYSVEKAPSLSFEKIGFESYLSGTMIRSWYGEYVLFANSRDTVLVTQNHLKELAKMVIDNIPDQKKDTPILDSFPESDLVKHSKKFYTQNWLAQDYFKNVYYADYYTQRGYSRIFIIDNGYTAAADSNFWKYHSFMNKNAVLLPNELKLSTDYYIVDDPLWGKTILAKKNQIIYGILDYHDVEWTENRLEELLERLKKHKIVKRG